MNQVDAITDPNVISFPKLGWSFNVDPTAFSLFGKFDIQWYGVLITVGMILAFIYVYSRLKRFGLDPDRAFDVIIGGIFGGVIGARVFYVVMSWDEYKDNIKEIFNIRNGGLAVYGGIIGAILVGLVITKIRKVRRLPMLDVTVLGLLIGQSIGRWGNFFNQEAFGTNTDNIFGMTGGRIQAAILNGMQMGGAMYNSGVETAWDKAVHPCFLYESVWCLIGFIILALFAKKRKYDGQLFLMYLTWYGAERFIVEGLRTDSLMIGNIRISQAISAIIFIVSVILQIVFYFRRKRDPEAFTLYVSTEESMRLIEEGRRKIMGADGADEDDDIGILPDEDDEDDVGILPDEDDDDDVGILPDEEDAEEAAEKAETVAEAVKEKAEDAVEAVTDAAEETAEAVIDKIEDAADAVDDKYGHIAEAIDEKLTGGTAKGSHSKKKKHHRK